MNTTMECAKTASNIAIIVHDSLTADQAKSHIESYLCWVRDFPKDLAHNIACEVVTRKLLFNSLNVDDYAFGLLMGLDMAKEVSA